MRAASPSAVARRGQDFRFLATHTCRTAQQKSPLNSVWPWGSRNRKSVSSTRRLVRFDHDILPRHRVRLDPRFDQTMLSCVHKGHDRHLVHQDLLRLPVQPHPFTLVGCAPRPRNKLIVSFVPPARVALDTAGPQKAVGVGIVRRPARAAQVRWILGHPLLKRGPTLSLPHDVGAQDLPPLCPQGLKVDRRAGGH